MVVVNDIHSQLNRCEVCEIVEVTSVEDVQAVVRRAVAGELPVCIAGADTPRLRYGGTTSARGGWR